jgi:hypothetical protein
MVSPSGPPRVREHREKERVFAEQMSALREDAAETQQRTEEARKAAVQVSRAIARGTCGLRSVLTRQPCAQKVEAAHRQMEEAQVRFSSEVCARARVRAPHEVLTRALAQLENMRSQLGSALGRAAALSRDFETKVPIRSDKLFVSLHLNRRRGADGTAERHSCGCRQGGAPGARKRHRRRGGRPHRHQGGARGHGAGRRAADRRAGAEQGAACRCAARRAGRAEGAPESSHARSPVARAHSRRVPRVCAQRLEDVVALIDGEVDGPTLVREPAAGRRSHRGADAARAGRDQVGDAAHA